MSGHSATGSASLCCPEDVGEQSRPGTWISSPPCYDESFFDHLFVSETKQVLHSVDYLPFCRNPTSRQDSIHWILKVHAYYRFKPVTALLSVNYFDRFLSSHTLPGGGWPYQLLSVACLSLAAKMEELYVPLLMDLQILEPRYVFEPKSIQRMELWVMANLKWRLRSVTPFDFLDYFISKLQSSGPCVLNKTMASSSSDIILKTVRVTDFLSYSPSVIAAAAVMTAAGGIEQLPDAFFQRIDKETLRSCHQLIQEYLLDSCPSIGDRDPKVMTSVEQRPLASPPPSPSGILDAAAACISCETRSENPSSTISGTVAEPEPKRLRSFLEDVHE